MRKVQKAKRPDGRLKLSVGKFLELPSRQLNQKLYLVLLLVVWFSLGLLTGKIYDHPVAIARTAFLELGLLCNGDYTNVVATDDQVSANCGNGDPVIVQNFLDR